jgi:hypothetical protein
MFILVGVPLALAVGLLAGGRLDRLGAQRIAWWWIGPVAFAAQLAAVYAAWTPDGLDLALIAGSHLALTVVALANRRLPGAPVVAAGLVLNLAVMLANGGLMPVAPETLQRAGRFEPWKVGAGTPGSRVASSKDVVLPAEQTRLEFLADRYWTGLPGRLGFIFSVGDVVLTAGVFIFVVSTLTTAPGARARKESPHVSAAQLAAGRRLVVPAFWE